MAAAEHDLAPEDAADHPAEYSAAVLEVLEQVLAAYLPLPTSGPAPLVVDPYAGRGSGVELIAGLGYRAVGLELEPEWACSSPLVQVGDALALPAELDPAAIVTSPCYGNRMADHHEAKDPCSSCAGEGCDEGCGRSGRGCQNGFSGPDSHRLCSTCRGSGLSKRVTYRHQLGRELTAGSAAGMQWSRDYREHHELAVGGWLSRLPTGEDGLVVVNMKNHFRGGAEQLVVEWWLNLLLVRGCRLLDVIRVATPGMGFGANGSLRTECEFVLAVRPPAERRLL